jgi:hypothetical protein
MKWKNVDDWSVGVDLELGLSLDPFKELLELLFLKLPRPVSNM